MYRIRARVRGEHVEETLATARAALAKYRELQVKGGVTQCAAYCDGERLDFDELVQRAEEEDGD